MSQPSQLKTLLENCYQYFKVKADSLQLIHNYPYVLFVSYGNAQQRAKVWQSADSDFAVAWKRCINFLNKLYSTNNGLPEFVKLDLAYHYQPIGFSDLQQQFTAQPHNNHFRRGVAFDGKFELAFLEQELYANAIIKSEKITEPTYFDQTNLNSYLKKKYNHQPKIDLNALSNTSANDQSKNNQSVVLFDTFGLFIQNNTVIELHSGGMLNGSRIINENQFKSHIYELINANAGYLHRQIQPSGKFYYGYFPAYNRALKSYNTVRHCTSLYALIESLEVIEPIPRQSVYLTRIRQAIDYALQHLYVEIEHEQPQRGYMIDGVAGQQEIKLGANAAAILMISKYQQLTQDQQYLPYAEKIAQGILSMIADSGETVHVLNYPALDLKEKFRIVYYDGEAAFALLRLYQINRNPQLLATVERMFEHFIAKNYWKYHDHWLSYCTNELSQIKPEAKYVEFGLNNYLKNLNFIKNRQTAYATFLEMLMSAYKMVQRLSPEQHAELLEQARLPELTQTIQQRAQYQRIGFFYPEVAMYFASPQTILDAFFVRHDRFRTRIDDSEHNLSGYIAYYQHFNSVVAQSTSAA